MAEPEEIKFACIGCGTFNPVDAEVCAGCGHRFAGPDVISKVRIALPPRPSDNPYEPPSAPIAPPRTFRIGSLLAWTALIAVCLGAYRENIALGILTTITFVPPSLWISIRAGNRRAQGHPMGFEDRFQAFWVAMFATWGIAISATIAFCTTCIGTSVATGNASAGVATGVVVVVAFLSWLIHILIRNGREQARREREIRYFRNPSEGRYQS